MVNSKKRSFLKTIPSFVLAILTLIIALFLTFGIGEDVGGEVGGILAYSINGLVIAAACYFIIRNNPGSIWYVPIICNLMGILAAIIEPTFWRSSMWIIMVAGWLLSLSASVFGALQVRKSATE